MPFVVAERVPWEKMCDTLNLKFMAEVQTTKGLLKEHYFFLAQKIFNDHSASLEDFQSRSVSWAQFNKVTGRAGQGGQGPVWPGEPDTFSLPQEILPGRGFTFWQWFDGVLDLTKRCLKSYWSDRWVPRGQVGFHGCSGTWGVLVPPLRPGTGLLSHLSIPLGSSSASSASSTSASS